jgi:hypothetical protein
MPAISQIGFGTNDYANIASWLAAEENNDYSGAGPIAEISSAAPQVLSADFSFRYGTATKYTVRAATGSEFNGNSDGSHAKISSAAAQRIYIRKPNVKFENIEISSNISFTSDDFTGLEFAGCYLHYIEGREINATVTSPILFTDCILVQDADTYNRTLQLRGGADSIFTRCTIIARSGTGSIGALYVRDATTDVVINQTAIYASAGPSLANHGDAPAPTGDNNAAHDALLPGAGSIATLTTADFVDYANGDYRIDSGSSLVGAGSGGGDIGAFVQSSVTPVLSAPTPSGSLGTQTTATLGATTDVSSGTFYVVVDSAANISGITGSQIIDGNNANDVAAVASNSSTVSTTSPTVGVTGLTAGTLYSYAVVQSGGSNVLTGTFTTAAATPAIVNIDGDDDVTVGQENVTINCANLPATVSSWSATLGGEALTPLLWNSGQPTVDIPAGISLTPGGGPYTLSLTYTE